MKVSEDSVGQLTELLNSSFSSSSLTAKMLIIDAGYTRLCVCVCVCVCVCDYESHTLKVILPPGN